MAGRFMASFFRARPVLSAFPIRPELAPAPCLPNREIGQHGLDVPRRMRLFLGRCFPALPSRGPVSTALLSDRPFGVRVDGTGLVDEGVAHCPIHQLPRFDSVAVKRCNGADQWRVVIVRHGLAGKMMISADIGIATASRASTVITGRGRRSTGTPTGQ